MTNVLQPFKEAETLRVKEIDISLVALRIESLNNPVNLFIDCVMKVGNIKLRRWGGCTWEERLFWQEKRLTEDLHGTNKDWDLKPRKYRREYSLEREREKKKGPR